MIDSKSKIDSHHARRVAVSALYVCIVIVFIGIAIVALAGRSGVEKYITRLVQPVGASFFLLSIAIVESVRQRCRTVVALSAIPTVLVGGFGNDLIAQRMMASVEESSRAAAVQTGNAPISSRFDTVIVLGGGVTIRPDGSAGGNRNSDRLIRAASLYHAGQTAQFITTGSRIKGLSALDRNESTLSREVLVSLGVPPDCITELSGRNTSEEFQSLAATLSSDSHSAIVTSAKHMPRVLRLAERYGMTLTPIPADFRSSFAKKNGNTVPLGIRIISIVPTANSLDLSASAIHEWLASIAGR